jgi:hypothetical protein
MVVRRLSIQTSHHKTRNFHRDSRFVYYREYVDQQNTGPAGLSSVRLFAYSYLRQSSGERNK